MIARAYVENGARVYITARRADACIALAEELSKIGACIAIPADLSRMEEIARLSGELHKREKKLDILVNNAGASWGATFAEFPENGWDKVMDLNVKSVFFLTHRGRCVSIGKGSQCGYSGAGRTMPSGGAVSALKETVATQRPNVKVIFEEYAPPQATDFTAWHRECSRR
jgi:NAD(P)-dependent dehydrogenase (short-subunit alcohol dehydrogenase family)